MCVLCQLGAEIITCACVYVCVLCASKACVLPRRPEADVRSLRAGVIGSYDLPSVGTGNQI